jgi:hydroxymethylglutaryl-CoA synthase
MRSAHFARDFETKIGSSLVAPELVGNSYSVSVFVGLDSLLENERTDLSGKTVVLCGYGSGSHAVILGNKVPDDYRAAAKKLELMRLLNDRSKLSVEEYELIHKGEIEPEGWTRRGRGKRFVLQSIGVKETPSEGDREYTLAN